ncbi:hypothetical protein [Acidicapsa acidisoli]|uniref:hypothetical protein n=1 Tax=Acidicapsa acidisoli TaxID=1615681 RepID=UPI0021E0EC41|nr:hypothetical protein [Acidicapsa acidisoli]
MEPATGAIIGTVAGSLTLANALIKICQEHLQDQTGIPSNVAELVATLPAAVLRATDDIIKQVGDLRAECVKAGIDLTQNLDELRGNTENTSFFQRGRRRILKTFQAKAEAIATEISILFDDVVSVLDCADRLRLVSYSFEASQGEKEELRRDTEEGLPLGTILRSLIDHAEKAKIKIGDLNRKK